MSQSAYMLHTFKYLSVVIVSRVKIITFKSYIFASKGLQIKSII
jgi:hypothetical protein